MLKSRDIQALKFHCCRQFVSSHYFMKGFISMDINLELYKVFYYVATTLSFSEASRQLFISQSAVSQSIKTLEKKLNHPLFIRSTKKVLLTPEGELLLQHVKPALQLLDEGESLLSGDNLLKRPAAYCCQLIRSAGIFSLILQKFIKLPGCPYQSHKQYLHRLCRASGERSGRSDCMQLS